ncbi:3' terminal RNA ribose 2'-O-methyltransferase Hen1 [Yimella sp. cx-51]|uniref:3' terminal RNA ribose 2'-O-methyltransferase Hen1 n=1 Tax=Yimella sp. cx-51 TaxID=2770551 RepID=UPI00165E14F1|nr:3' terminal RNA ribose 2'-O-methyltransferase Hen1 [Yimella sp. cx-51]MBC9956090.1 3' terminal RNA ribose 2'-O-methyltransferase Hen1 [Yimella sp. cx-51]QTH37380.1 3' terminal RNA ribose 2'-O-methyltransferase Hen1 [Yimella sp. cx-51]
MLLTISTTHQPASDLGYLLHKHPDRVQVFEQSFGTATVFYPEVSHERCTAALLLEIDSLQLARSRKKNAPDFSLSQYVNDRPYAASSLLAVAMARVFSTARSGTCKGRQELADSAIPLEITLPVLPARGGVDLVRRLFEPLGWTVDAEPVVLDERFPEWGESRYVCLRLIGTVRLADALNQLHVLLPALDESKHYWQGSDEVDKLMRSGAGWLAQHPESEQITRRYLGRQGRLTRDALARLAELGDEAEDALDPADEAVTSTAPQRIPLNKQRHEAVLVAVEEVGATSVIDLGCGSGALLEKLVKLSGLRRIAGCDVSIRSLQIAGRRLYIDRMTERQAERVQLFQAALTYEDARFAGYDAAVLMEVIEHVELSRLPALERVVFGAARPRTVLVTTPNREYNKLYEGMTGMRHPDHRFEWDRAEFARWADEVCSRYGYRVEHRGIGDIDDALGSPTQFGIFTRTDNDAATTKEDAQ